MTPTKRKTRKKVSGDPEKVRAKDVFKGLGYVGIWIAVLFAIGACIALINTALRHLGWT